MGEKITDAQAAELLALLRTDTSVDAKVAQINHVKSGIKQNNVPDACVGSLFEITRISMSSQQAALVNAGFTTLNHLLTRLSRQEPKHITREAIRTLPFVIDKLGDTKDKFRALAGQCLTALWKAAPGDVEKAVRETAMMGKNARAKETAAQWVVQVGQTSLETQLSNPNCDLTDAYRQWPPIQKLRADLDGVVGRCRWDGQGRSAGCRG
jgi:CLIP-associating protein 1/2